MVGTIYYYNFIDDKTERWVQEFIQGHKAWICGAKF